MKDISPEINSPETPETEEISPMDKARAIIDECFSNIVGQEKAENRIKTYFLSAVAQNGFFPCILLVAPPGIGKTKFMHAIKDCTIRLFGSKSEFEQKRKAISFETGARLGSSSAFFEDVLVPHVDGQPCAIFIDEIHEAQPKTLNLIRTLIEPRVDRSAKTVKVNEMEVTFCPRIHSLIIATNEIDKLPPALVSRFERIDLELYGDDEMEQILFSMVAESGIRFSENTLRDIAACSRGTARDIVKWVEAIRSVCAISGKKTINKKDVAEIIHFRNTFPLGVTEAEIRTLLILENGARQRKELAAQNNITAHEQEEMEKYLFKRRLIKIDGERRITAEGLQYLRDLRAENYIE